MTQRRLLPLFAASAIAAVLLSGCSSSGGASDAGAWTEYAVEAEGSDAASLDADDADRDLVVTGTVTMTVDDPIDAANEARDLVVSAGGRVDAREQSAPRDGHSGTAQLQLRIPADELEGVLDQLGDLGRIDDTSTQSVSVGTQQRDIEARMTTLRTSIARYTTWLATAQTTSDLIELEGAISQRQIELESLEAQQRTLADQVAFSTIELHLYSDDTSPVATGPSDFGSALVVGWEAFAAFWIGATVVLGVLLPWLLLLGATGAVVILIVRARRRRDGAGPSTEPGHSTPA
ncbi:DUF4349 domain-containing protein [Salinibacterium sp. ZJ77]|uniref:DUF4349 domain-containing protein n=1 Tax=Salinibacterium sp. ZJ77 TaxID=2708337 RepID=UPI00142465A2|nr:DUF4349 domain-containing protein [Salinibacterium sp. ZJ77]